MGIAIIHFGSALDLAKPSDVEGKVTIFHEEHFTLTCVSIVTIDPESTPISFWSSCKDGTTLFFGVDGGCQWEILASIQSGVFEILT